MMASNLGTASARTTTIRDVARLAGVSVGTVSNVLNGRRNVREDTRRRVESVIRDLDFAPDVTARSLTLRWRDAGGPTPLAQRYQALLSERQLPPPPPAVTELLAQIVERSGPGASRQVRLAHRLMVQIAQGHPDSHLARQMIAATASFIAQTRGQDAPVVANAVNWLLDDPAGADGGDLAALLSARAATWIAEADLRLDRLTTSGAALLGAGARPLLFEYSSTVAKVIGRLHTAGLVPAPIVLESQATGGGERYARDFADKGLIVRRLPDTALEYALEAASAVVMGCDKLYADGAIANAVGSRLVARTARSMGVAVYGCADFFKLDRGSLQDEPDTTVRQALMITQDPPVIETVSADLLAGLITELGVIRPESVRPLAQDLFDRHRA